MLRIRLRRMGTRNRPFYRVVVSDSRKTPTASALDEVGYYDPTTEPARIQIDAEQVEKWVGKGARVTPTVKRLLRQQTSSAA